MRSESERGQLVNTFSIAASHVFFGGGALSFRTPKQSRDPQLENSCSTTDAPFNIKMHFAIPAPFCRRGNEGEIWGTDRERGERGERERDREKRAKREREKGRKGGAKIISALLCSQLPDQAGAMPGTTTLLVGLLSGVVLTARFDFQHVLAGARRLAALRPAKFNLSPQTTPFLESLWL